MRLKKMRLLIVNKTRVAEISVRTSKQFHRVVECAIRTDSYLVNFERGWKYYCPILEAIQDA